MSFYSDNRVTVDQLANLRTPEGTRTHKPIAHHWIRELAAKEVVRSGATILNEEHGTDKDGDRYFGILHLGFDNSPDDYRWTLGLRNAHDKAFAAGVCIGPNVMVCSNLSFFGELTLARKHTVNVHRDLPFVVREVCERLLAKRFELDYRIQSYKETELTEKDGNDFLIRALENGAVTGSSLTKVVKEYREPRHEEFRGRTMWSLINAFTEVAKETDNPGILTARTSRLHTMADEYIGFNPLAV